MTKPELAHYVKKQLRKGFPAGELQQELLRQGFTEAEIEEAFKPRRQWRDPSQGFSARQLIGPAIVVLAGLVFTGKGRFSPLDSGISITCTCVVLVYLFWRYRR